jgi:hypothetical protein
LSRLMLTITGWAGPLEDCPAFLRGKMMLKLFTLSLAGISSQSNWQSLITRSEIFGLSRSLFLPPFLQSICACLSPSFPLSPSMSPSMSLPRSLSPSRTTYDRFLSSCSCQNEKSGFDSSVPWKKTFLEAQFLRDKAHLRP